MKQKVYVWSLIKNGAFSSYLHTLLTSGSEIVDNIHSITITKYDKDAHYHNNAIEAVVIVNIKLQPTKDILYINKKVYYQNIHLNLIQCTIIGFENDKVRVRFSNNHTQHVLKSQIYTNL